MHAFNYLRTPNDSSPHRWVKGNVNVDSKYHTTPHYRCRMSDLYFHTIDGPTMWHYRVQQQLLTPEHKVNVGVCVFIKGKDVC